MRTAPADGCLCYTTDLSYALPTLLSAMQARVNLSARTDVTVFLVGAVPDQVSRLAPAYTQVGVDLVPVPRDAIDGLSVQFARHFLDRLLHPHYRRVAHVDGDTHVLGCLDPLLDIEVTPGRVLAVPDPMALVASTRGLLWRPHRTRMAAIGLKPAEARRYANTGIFRVRREDLGGFGEACRMFALKEGARLRFGEQDAFNVVLGPRIDLASLRWNYPAFFSNFAFEHLVDPRVRHFMSNPRPWQGSFPPWGRPGQAFYLDLVYRHPELACLASPLKGRRRLRYEVQQRVKRFVEPIFWDTVHTRNRIAEHEATAIV